MELEEREPVEDTDDSDVEDDDEEIADPEEVEAELARSSDSDDESESEDASLDELLAQRAARRPPDEPEDPEDILTLSSEAKTKIKEPLPSRVIPIRDRQEFVCSNCHLVKMKSQLADADRLLCRDCV